MNKKDVASFLQKTTVKLIDLLEQPVSKIEVKENSGFFKIHLQTDQPGELIGFRGKTLEALGLLIQLAVFQKFGSEVKALVDVNDYRQSQEEEIKNLALQAAQKAKETGQPIFLPPMSSYKRRLIHLELANDPEVNTLSQGQSLNRYVVVRPGEAEESPSSEA